MSVGDPPRPREIYYELPSAAKALAARIAAIRSCVPKGSRVIDLGCNDGRLSLALLESGHASHVIGYDLEPPPVGLHPTFQPVAGNLLDLDVATLPRVDVVLLLNIAHHLLVRGAGFVERLITGLLSVAPVVLVDMGSLTETDRWPWRRLMAHLWSSDEEMWAELFAGASWRRRLLTYPFQRGRRVLFKLAAPPAVPYRYRRQASYRRIVSTPAEKKRLLEVQSETDQPIPFGAPRGMLCPEVLFHRLLREETGELFWAKEYRSERAAPWMRRIEEQVQQFVRTLPHQSSTCIEVSPEHGYVHVYEPELFNGLVAHRTAAARFFHPAECREIEAFGERCMRDGELAGIPLRYLTDFQVVRTTHGLMFLDFEPHHRHWSLLKDLMETPADHSVRARVMNQAYRLPGNGSNA